MPTPVNVSIVYYSATGTIHSFAACAAQEASKIDGAQVRLRRAAELAPAEAIARNPAWREHAEATKDIPTVSHDDMEWAQVIMFGTPTRFGLPAAQLKQFMDTLSPLWEAGKLTNKVVSSFTASATAHGGQETTIVALNNSLYHWGCIIVPPGYGEPNQFKTGNPYGTSHAQTSQPLPGEGELTSMRFQTRRTVDVGRALLRGGLGD